jgi:hypothetical protein
MVTEVVHRAGERFYELLADGQFAGLVVYEADPLIDASHPGSWDKSQPAGTASERTSQ